jgi:hypothetical protein
MEVDEESNTEARQLQVGKKLSHVDRQQLIDCLRFDDHRFVHDQIESIGTVELYPLVDDRQRPSAVPL